VAVEAVEVASVGEVPYNSCWSTGWLRIFIPKLAIPFTTLSKHLRMSMSFVSLFIVLLLTPKLKNNRRIKGAKAVDVNKQRPQAKCQLPE